MNKALVTVATGPYNQYVNALIKSAKRHFQGHIYLFTDRPNDYRHFNNVTIVEIPHLGWPRMPLLRWDLLYKHKDLWKESYIFLIDVDSYFVRDVNQSVLSHRVGTLHRNITRYREDFNYESRTESKAYVGPKEGEKYFACGFVGGRKTEFVRMSEMMSRNIRADIRNGIRAVWGDESHLNKYFIDNKPTLVLPPSYMCPADNPHFQPYITHQRKQFKAVNIEDTDEHLTVDPKDYDIKW